MWIPGDIMGICVGGAEWASPAYILTAFILIIVLPKIILSYAHVAFNRMRIQTR